MIARWLPAGSEVRAQTVRSSRAAAGSSTRLAAGAASGHRRDEAIAPAGNRLDVTGLRGGIAEGFAQLVDRGVEAVVEVHDGVVAPEALPHFARG